MIVRYLAVITAFLCFSTPSTLIADTSLSGKSVKAAIQKTLDLNKISATPIINDKKLFPKCGDTLFVNPSQKDWKTVSVRCDGENPWKIIVRNKFNALQSAGELGSTSHVRIDKKSQKFEEVRVGAIKRSIRRGDVIMPSDVIEISIPVNKATDIFPDYEDLIGRRAKTTIKALTPVFSRQLETNFMITEDMQVTIIHYGKHITVQMDGVAQENGQYGDWIEVKNSKSGRIILAKVVAEKKVTI